MNKKFTISCEMEERWIPAFYSMLKRMEHDGAIGHSEKIGFYADGDGDFRPQFTTDDEIEYDIDLPEPWLYTNRQSAHIFDAG